MVSPPFILALTVLLAFSEAPRFRLSELCLVSLVFETSLDRGALLLLPTLGFYSSVALGAGRPNLSPSADTVSATKATGPCLPEQVEGEGGYEMEEHGSPNEHPRRQVVLKWARLTR